MRCYFLRGGRIAGVEILPLGLSDEDAIARAHALSAKRKGPFDSFEVWDHARFVFRRPRPPRSLGFGRARSDPSPQTPQDRLALISSSRRALIRPISWRLKDGPSS